MAVLHEATLRPTKAEILAEWVPRQSWYPADAADFELLGRFRFDDPAGEVGIETFLLGSPDGTLFHVPMTYRGAPVPGLEAALIGTMEHSVLGDRWVYDATADPVYLAVLEEVIRTGAQQADQVVQMADGTTAEVPTTTRAYGRPSDGAGDRVEVVRTPDRSPAAAAASVLLATLPGQDAPIVLALLA
jgi:hypothetical protein